MRRMNRFLVAIVSIAIWGCGSSPAAPTTAQTGQNQTNTQSSTVPTAVLVPIEQTPCDDGLIWYESPNEGQTVTVVNGTECTIKAYAALWEMPDPPPQYDTQRFFSGREILALGPGKRATVVPAVPGGCAPCHSDVFLHFASTHAGVKGENIPPPHPVSMYWFGRT